MIRLVDPKCILAGSIKFKGHPIIEYPNEEMQAKIFMFTDNFKLYPGSLRKNLDPENLYKDEEIASVLEYCRYWSLIELERTSLGSTENFYQLMAKNKAYETRDKYGISINFKKEAPDYHKEHKALAKFRAFLRNDDLAQVVDKSGYTEPVDIKKGVTKQVNFS